MRQARPLLTAAADPNMSKQPAHPGIQRPTRSGRRAEYTRFTDAEQHNLLLGVARFGAGNWKRILAAYKFNPKRTAVDLKDKYRNILRAEDRLRAAKAASTSTAPHAPATPASSNANGTGPPRRPSGMSVSALLSPPDKSY